MFATKFALDPIVIAEKIGAVLLEEGRATEHVKAGLQRLADARRADNAKDMAARLPYFCSGCPHNTSTKVPEGSRAYAGIGCHYMVQWMGRDTVGFTQMGGEGANWIGESLFSKTPHVFQNLGDGTYNHSGVQAIRAALAAGTNITYKILFNDAVAMTGGQTNEGGLSADRIVREVQAMGVKNVTLVYDPKEDIDWAAYPDNLPRVTRDQLMQVQEKLRETKGVSVIVYVQTCAAEKRRRRKRGTFPDPDKRVFINTDVCEGCGDCGVQSNCVSIVPVETELGRKRAIDQSSCNKDFSCLSGFCPSFITLSGAMPKKAATAQLDLPDLPEPVLPAISGTHNIVITGVGGTGVVTVGAVLAMAAHLDGKGAAMMEMAGLAQKGGAVHIHCRLANRPEDISAIRVAVGEADAVIGGDLVVTAGSKTLGLMTLGRTGAVVNAHEVMTGDFTQKRDFQLPVSQLRLSLEAKLRDRLTMFDASDLSRRLLGDSIYANTLVFGAAWQAGLIPLSLASIMKAIELNGAGVAANQRAFALGRWALIAPEDVAAFLHPTKTISPDPIAFRAAHLVAYQGAALANRFRALVAKAPENLRESVAKGYHKLLSYKDEYEVARLHLSTMEKAREEFDGDLQPRFHLAPPLLPGKDAMGRPRKRAFGAWIIPVFRGLAALKTLRGTVFDPFGYGAERRAERRLIAEYEADMALVLPNASKANEALLRELAELPLSIRGFGPVKAAAMTKAAARRAEILAALQDQGPPQAVAAR